MQDGSKQQHGKTACPCCAKHYFNHSKCACCNGSRATHCCEAADSDSGAAGLQVVRGHRCKSIALYEVIPATVASSADVGDLHAPIFVLADHSLPKSFSHTQVVRVVEVDTGPPPNDLVVALHRLVI